MSTSEAFLYKVSVDVVIWIFQLSVSSPLLAAGVNSCVLVSLPVRHMLTFMPTMKQNHDESVNEMHVSFDCGMFLSIQGTSAYQEWAHRPLSRSTHKQQHSCKEKALPVVTVTACECANQSCSL